MRRPALTARFHQQQPVLRRNSGSVLENGPKSTHWHLQYPILDERGLSRLISDKFPAAQPFIIDRL
jgi:hypothetical protein